MQVDCQPAAARTRTHRVRQHRLHEAAVQTQQPAKTSWTLYPLGAATKLHGAAEEDKAYSSPVDSVDSLPAVAGPRTLRVWQPELHEAAKEADNPASRCWAPYQLGAATKLRAERLPEYRAIHW